MSSLINTDSEKNKTIDRFPDQSANWTSENIEANHSQSEQARQKQTDSGQINLSNNETSSHVHEVSASAKWFINEHPRVPMGRGFPRPEKKLEPGRVPELNQVFGKLYF